MRFVWIEDRRAGGMIESFVLVPFRYIEEVGLRISRFHSKPAVRTDVVLWRERHVLDFAVF
jgi:hypothetical protein